MGVVTAIVPVKALAHAKGRMAAELDPALRGELVAWMLGRVLAACTASEVIGEILVIAGDGAAADLVGPGPARVLVEPRPGLQHALAAADATTAGRPATLVVAADLPLVLAADLDAVWGAATGDRCVVVAPTRDGGTGALLRLPGGIIATAYGPGSAAAHLALAAAAGVAAVRVERAGLAFDVDTPAQLAELAALHAAGLPSR